MPTQILGHSLPDRRPAEPRGRPAVLRHHQHVLRARRAREAGEGAFRVYGHSKDHRPDLPQVVIGLAVTREGIPVRVWCWPGNTNDMSVISRGQGRPARLAAGPRRDGRRPRLLLATRTCATSPRRRALDRRRADARRQPDAQAALVAPGPLPDRPRQPARQGGPRRRRRRGQALHRLPQPRRGRPRRTQRDETIRRLQAELERIATQRARPRAPTPRSAHARRVRAARPPHARALPAPDQDRAAASSTAPRSRPRSAWTASTCSPPPTPTSPPRTSRSATRTCSKPNAASAT